MKTLLLGIAFTIAGAGCLAFPDPWSLSLAAGTGFTGLGLLLAIMGALKKKPEE